MEQTSKDNKMREMPVKKLLPVMGIPMILSMILQAFYNIVDSAFISNMEANGEFALHALILAFPFQMLMVAIGIGTGVGANVLTAKCLGQGNSEKASKAAGNAQFLAFLIYIVFLLFGIFGVPFYIASQTDNQTIYDMAIEYLTICSIGSLGIIFFAIYEKLLQAAGHSICSTIAQVAGAVTNILLDPIMIYGWFGCPAMGIRGAAWATVIGQCVSFGAALLFYFRCNPQLSKKLKNYKPSMQIIKEIYAVGLPAILAQALMSIMTYALNIIFGIVNEAMITAYGMFYKIEQFMLFAAFGLRDAITPIVSFAHGMNNKKRMRDGIKYGVFYTGTLLFIGTLFTELLASPFAAAFHLSGETAVLFTDATHIISISFLLAGISIALQGVLQALNRGTASLLVSLCRQIIFVLPTAWGLALLTQKVHLPLSIIWITFPLAEGITAILACLMMRHITKEWE